MLPPMVGVGAAWNRCDDGRVTEPTDPETRRSGQPRRKRLSVADVFGDVLPDVTGDELSPEPTGPGDDTWYQDNRPPHHDRG
jgi:hypothetical protein